MHKNTAPKTALLMTGNELMSGDILDSNYSTVAKTLLEIGIEVQEKVTVGDDLELLVKQMKRLSQDYALVIINGGLGPTSDDLTAEAMALTFNRDIKLHSEAKTHLEHWCKKRQAELTESNLKQALLPEDSHIFDDAPGSAPAFWLQNDQALVIATPGVPYELNNILQEKIIPFLMGRFDLDHEKRWQIITLFGIGESSLQELVNQSPVSNKNLRLGYRAYLPYIEFKYLIPNDISKNERHSIQKDIMELIEPFYVGIGKTNIAKALSHILDKKQLTLSTAESCTGGLVAHYMTKIAGASSVFEGAAVTYSNALKMAILQVPEETLNKHGAVSKETANAMLTGLLNLTKTDYGIAVTGIAGPDGGTDEKPVGTVYIAWGTLTAPNVIHLRVAMPRTAFQTVVATVALDLVRHQIVEKMLPAYISKWQVGEEADVQGSN